MRVVTNEELNAHYAIIRPFVEGDSSAVKGLLKSWCPAYLQDAQETAEGLMLEFNMDVADRYLYGLCSCVTSAFIENGRTLPELTDDRYAELSSSLLSIRSQESEYTMLYFEQLMLDFSVRLPMTKLVLESLERDLVTRLRVAQDEVDYGFYPGAEHCMSIIAEVMRQ
jgi:hypothetical protein